jgi:hypothetical protein
VCQVRDREKIDVYGHAIRGAQTTKYQWWVSICVWASGCWCCQLRLRRSRVFVCVSATALPRQFCGVRSLRTPDPLGDRAAPPVSQLVMPDYRVLAFLFSTQPVFAGGDVCPLSFRTRSRSAWLPFSHSSIAHARATTPNVHSCHTTPAHQSQHDIGAANRMGSCLCALLPKDVSRAPEGAHQRAPHVCAPERADGGHFGRRFER